MHGNLAPLPRCLQREQRVLDLLLERDIAIADCNRFERYARMPCRKENRDRVIPRGVSIYDKAHDGPNAERSLDGRLAGGPR
jgi:hypothetical protein